MSLSTGVYVIYEPGVSASPILLHNVPIRDSRHCGSVHHLAPATSTPGERERKRDREPKDKEKKRRNKGEKKGDALSFNQLSPYAFIELRLSTAEHKQAKKETKNMIGKQTGNKEVL